MLLGSRATRFTCRITAAPWVFAWPWPIRIESRVSLSRMQWRTTKAWARFGRRVGPFGPTAPPTKARFVPTCCRCKRRGRAMSEAIPTWNAMTPICGRMNLLFSISPARSRFRATCSTTTAPTSKTIPGGKAWMHEKQPRLLVIWGKYESSFDSSEPESYRRDVPNAEVHIVDGGHFALDTAADEIAELIGQFIRTQK